ncbi:hypothetical protein H6P81_008474 [Aristolochia fimbriata]|uniref:WW domain-containing protein n=1 Tax=Aristolochia fimbriata TaxID=158543 RepID=A0AAV7EJK9_ARIFI|nr:hypothetical protein H6P81_008474 [Aristolochia fimbriata]
MGKRKERRLAALSNAGRRVKLDLFAEPSGDVAGTSVHDEVKEDLGQNHGARVPISPSSGKQTENPLLLLGQYSDDESDRKEKKILKLASTKSSDDDHNEQAQEHMDANGVVDQDSIKPDPADYLSKETSFHKDIGGNNEQVAAGSMEENDGDAVPDQHGTAESMPQIYASVTSETQVVGDVTCGWKLVMHEESNQYYYWNTITGETSWEEPDISIQAAENGSTDVANLSMKPDVGSDIPDDVPGRDSIAKLDTKHANGLSLGTVANQNGVLGEIDESCMESLGLTNPVSAQDLNGSPNGDGSRTIVEDSNVPSRAYEDIPSWLVEYGENLLQRLNVLKGSSNWSSKFMIEVEIRLSDCKALSSCGSTLMPFWQHSVAQLKRIESAILEHETSQLAKSVPLSKESQPISSRGISEETEDMVHRDDRGPSCCTESSLISPAIDCLTHVVNEPKLEILGEVGNSSVSTTLELKNEPDVHEEVDMDVDMEVDDESSAKHNMSQDASGSEQFSSWQPVLQPNVDPSPLELQSSLPTEEFSIPPPPDEEWIPPPPPDNEPSPPPPPPDDIPLPSYPPPPYPETLPSLPYTEQYNLAYPSSTYEYYAAPLTEVAATGYYMAAEASQIPESQPPSYYEAVANGLSEAAPSVVNPVGPAIYYDLPNGHVSSASHYYSEPVITTIDNDTASDHPKSHGVISNSDVSDLGLRTTHGEPDMNAVGGTVSTATSQAVRTGVENETASVASATTSTAKPKVMRNKKHTIAVAPTLRSNKKVSSLVDKWKAAKEELHAEEDEPENAYEILEKKRQKEIEEWRAQQIASGEALDNANFQPLGGDWRERVKRKKAASRQTSVDTKTSPEATTTEKQPNLVELSKDLPSGWQAYWDESSKSVYYGNVITSETTWTRPT